MTLAGLDSKLKKMANTERAKLSQRYFKTGPGEYGEEDIFIGLTVPECRLLAKEFSARANLENIKNLLDSGIHEKRLIGLLILIVKYESAGQDGKRDIVRFYIDNTHRINNWDLVDLSAPKILGAYLLENRTERKILFKLARSGNMWERRISILATFPFIRNGEFRESLELAKQLLTDREDLMHKAVGWMLREIGKRNLKAEEAFLAKFAGRMPRTMLRYAIKKFSEKKRQNYLKEAKFAFK